MKAELQERERRAKLRRQQEMDRRVHKNIRNDNAATQGPIGKIKQEAMAFDINGLWNKFRKDEKDKKKTAAPAAKSETAAAPEQDKEAAAG